MGLCRIVPDPWIENGGGHRFFHVDEMAHCQQQDAWTDYTASGIRSATTSGDRPTRPARLCSEGVADLVDGNRKGSTSPQTPSTAGNPAQTRPPSAPVDGIWTEQTRHERRLQKPINGSEHQAQSPLSDSNRRPLPYHGRVRVLRAFTDALRRALNPCKQPQSGLYGCGGRFAVVVDLVDAEWTRSRRSESQSCGPRLS
jgi:hypothetical protein